MMNILSYFKCILLICIFSCANVTWAYEKDFGSHIVYYSLFTSDFLQAQIAKPLGIVRSHDRIILNIAVHKKTANGSIPVAASLSGNANDLIHTRFITFQEINEGDAIYYLGQFKAPGRQVYVFDIDIQLAEKNSAPLSLRFNHEVFATKQ